MNVLGLNVATNLSPVVHISETTDEHLITVPTFLQNLHVNEKLAEADKDKFAFMRSPSLQRVATAHI